MQSFLIDLLLNAYLSERSSSIGLSRFILPNVSQSENALLSLEKIYLNIQQSSVAKKPSDQSQEQGNDDNDETVMEQDYRESSQITITVCDEAKNLKRQFTCNRTLLIHEMRYFADYLKDDPDQVEEVDISVHCDLDIFQWLMSFVNRRSSGKAPDLEPRIAVSILISSDFLKMDKLVQQTLDYIHEHINEIMATNCNVACISDPLFRQLAQQFENPYEIEHIHDRKNRIRGKLFENSLERLLTEKKILRCQHCLTIMTLEQTDSSLCLSDRLIFKTNGQLACQHKVDPKFDINQWIKDIHTRGENSWRNTFWIIWLHFHGDRCVRCNSYFRFIDFSTCSYHPVAMITEGKHSCCSQAISSFDILQLLNRDGGCQQREHLCQTQNYLAEIYDGLDKTELLKNHPALRTTSIEKNRTNLVVSKIIEQSIYGTVHNEGQKSLLRAQWTPLLDTRPYGADVKYIWDATKSTRWNQDTQREDEHRRFEEMLRYILSIQQNTKILSNRTSKETSTSALVSPGGLYCRIENEWRTRQNSSTNSNANTNKNRQRPTLK